MTGRLAGSAARDEGFTLLELIVVMVIGSVLMAIGSVGAMSWKRGAEERGSVKQLQSTLRAAAENATAEGRAYCVDLSGNRTFSTWRYACSSATGTQTTGAMQTQSSQVTFVATSTFTAPAPACPAGDTCFYFWPRGTATPGTVTVSSSARSNVYVIHVEGLTSRVYY